MTNLEIYNSLANRYVAVGISKVCEQLAEMSGCFIPESRAGFVKFDYIGPRGPVFIVKNPPNPSLVCNNRGTYKINCS